MNGRGTRGSEGEALTGDLSRKITTTKITREVVSGTKNGNQRKETSETTTADVPPSVWERLMGPSIVILAAWAIVLLAAFLAGAAVQRVLLGHYEFSLGPLALKEITGTVLQEKVHDAMAAMPTPSAEAPAEAVPEPTWATVDDPNLALAGWRIDLEQTLRDLAEHYGIQERRAGVGQLLRLLSQREVLNPGAIPRLEDLLSLANQAVHGAQVDASVLPVLRSDGRRVLEYLRRLPEPSSP
jgi:hypothetical protein